MPGVNYSSWPLAKLKKERDRIDRAIENKDGERNKAIAAIKQAAKKSGFELKELFEDIGGSSNGGGARRTKKKAGAKRRKLGKVPPKYRNPEDKTQTWSGRGRQPLWVAAWEKKHGNLDGIRIKS